jgi:hypothetical protein
MLQCMCHEQSALQQLVHVTTQGLVRVPTLPCQCACKLELPEYRVWMLQFNIFCGVRIYACYSVSLP